MKVHRIAASLFARTGASKALQTPNIPGARRPGGKFARSPVNKSPDARLRRPDQKGVRGFRKRDRFAPRAWDHDVPGCSNLWWFIRMSTECRQFGAR